MPIATVNDVFEYLLGFVNMEQGHTVDYRLDRIKFLLDRLGSPERALPCVHVTGSKGKGSVCTMLASILEATGQKTGLYTSPHLLDYRERITRSGAFLPDDLYLRAFSLLEPLVASRDPSAFPGGELPSFFELCTTLAFLAFREGNFDAAVYEVGLGGRLDSTNVVVPEASVITTVELEHTEWLGDTLPAIAREKAGIIKDGVPAFTSATDPNVLDVIRGVAEAKRAGFRVLRDEAKFVDVRVDEAGTTALVEFSDRAIHPGPVEIRTPLVGRVQAENAALAFMTARLSSFDVPAAACLAGIANARLPGRFEIASRDPVVVLDGAHTPTSIANTVGTWRSLYSRGTLLFACAADKDARGMARALRGAFDSVVVTKPGTFKKSDPAAAADAFSSEGFDTTLEPDTAAAWKLARGRAAGRGEALLVAGSFYLCAEIMRALAGR